ncbi:MAG: DUF2085 domain-containing protein [Thermomicrobium sp.]|nr:DUF2085 domain-containing protein [Thermomicrobium sp.]
MEVRRVARSGQIRAVGRELLPPIACLLAIGALWLAGPDTVELATRAALHGLCAQRPSHSFWLGPYRLPFDARMTGIYAGSLFTVAWLAWRARYAAQSPSRWTIGALSVGVLWLALDGTNALAQDLGLPTLYAPHNGLRYVTGAWTGVSLGTLLWWIFVSTTWYPACRTHRPVVRPLPDLPVLAGSVAAFGWLVRSGPVLAYPLVAVGLLVAAVVTLGLLAWPFVLVATGRLERSSTGAELRRPALLAGLAAVAVMAATSTLRYAAESVLGLPPLS